MLRSKLVADLRPQFGKAYGVEEVITPNFDRFRSEGLVFNRSYVQVSSRHTLPQCLLFMYALHITICVCITRSAAFASPYSHPQIN